MCFVYKNMTVCKCCNIHTVGRSFSLFEMQTKIRKLILLMSLFCLHQQAKKSRIVASNEVMDKSRGAACFGNTCLTELLTSLAANTQNEASLRVGIVGKCSFYDASC